MRYKTALITGGTRGIGLGIAKVLLQAGIKVAITGRNSSQVNEVVAELSKDYGIQNVMGGVNDVRDAQGLEKLVENIVEKWGGLHILVANAGVGHFASIDSMTHQQWNETIDTNLTGVFNSVKACLPFLKSSKGYIFTIASLAGTNFFAKGSAYNASKFGLVGFSQAIMLDLRPYQVKVTTIMPGSVKSFFAGHTPSEQEDDWKIQPEDIGQLIVDLLQMHPRSLPSKIEIRPTMPR